MSGGAPNLTPKLKQVIASIPEAANPKRFQAMFERALQAMQALSDLDLSRYETLDFKSTGKDLWEHLAPTVRDTLNSVNHLLEIVRTEFGVSVRDGELKVDDAFDGMFEVKERRDGDEVEFPWQDSSGETIEDKLREVHALLVSITASLAKEITSFGEGVRQPSILDDRWFLLDHIAQFRGRFRTAIGEMIYAAARVFAEAPREEVIPSYRDDLQHSVDLRLALTRLRQECRVFHARMQSTVDNAELKAWGTRMLECLQAFMDGPAYRHFRAADKRAFLQGRQALVDLLADAAFNPHQVVRAADGMLRFLEGLSTINRRELIIAHDQDALSHAEMRLGSAADNLLRGGDTARGRRELKEAMEQCQRLAGRDPGFDSFLCMVAKLDVGRLDEAETLATIETFQKMLSLIPRPQ